MMTLKSIFTYIRDYQELENQFYIMGRWSRGMIPRSHRGDQEFESPPAH
jgi:hypothetical protein